MLLGKLLSYVISSVITRLALVGVMLLVLRFGPWGNLFQYAGIFGQHSKASQDFQEIAAAIESPDGGGVGYDPYLGPTGSTGFSASDPPPTYTPPQKSDGLFRGDGPFSGLARLFGFGDRPLEAPGWVPVFPGSIDRGTIRQWTPDGQKTTIRAAVPATGSSVANFYERAFTRQEYEFTREDNGTETTLTAASPDGARSLTVAVSARGARSTLALTHLERPAAAPAAAITSPPDASPTEQFRSE